jgi:hypothetical protein
VMSSGRKGCVIPIEWECVTVKPVMSKNQQVISVFVLEKLVTLALVPERVA